MKNRKIPMRTCVVSKEKCEKRELIRIVRTPEGKIIIDDSGKANGRGAYLKKDENIILKAKQNKILERHLQTKIEDDIYDELLNIVRG